LPLFLSVGQAALCGTQAIGLEEVLLARIAALGAQAVREHRAVLRRPTFVRTACNVGPSGQDGGPPVGRDDWA